MWLLELSLESKASDDTLGFCFNVGSKMFLAVRVFSDWQLCCYYSHPLASSPLFCWVFLTLEPKNRDMAYLLSSYCSWQPKKPTETAGKSCFGLLLSMVAAKDQGSSCGSSYGKQTDLEAGSQAGVTSETSRAICPCSPEPGSHSTFCSYPTDIPAVFSSGKERQQLTWEKSIGGPKSCCSEMSKELGSSLSLHFLQVALSSQAFYSYEVTMN